MLARIPPRPSSRQARVALAAALAVVLASHTAAAQRRRGRNPQPAHPQQPAAQQPAAQQQQQPPPQPAAQQQQQPPQQQPAAQQQHASAAQQQRAPAAADAPEPAAQREGPRSAAGNAAGQTLVSGAINRPGYHVTSVGGEVFGTIGPGGWAWPGSGLVASGGFRLSFPLTRNGMLERTNNDVRLMIGVQAYLAFVPPRFYWFLSAPITLQWNFFLSDQWSVLLEAGLAVDVYIVDDFYNCYDHPRLFCDRVFFHPAAAVGLRRHFGSGGPPGNGAVTFSFSYPSGVRVGLSW